MPQRAPNNNDSQIEQNQQLKVVGAALQTSNNAEKVPSGQVASLVPIITWKATAQWSYYA